MVAAKGATHAQGGTWNLSVCMPAHTYEFLSVWRILIRYITVVLYEMTCRKTGLLHVDPVPQVSSFAPALQYTVSITCRFIVVTAKLGCIRFLPPKF
jgi:hypothetical protein